MRREGEGGRSEGEGGGGEGEEGGHDEEGSSVEGARKEEVGKKGGGRNQTE